MKILQKRIVSKIHSANTNVVADLLPYPLDTALLVAVTPHALDGEKAHNGHSSAHHALTLAQCALNHWNNYLASGEICYLDLFLEQARWFVVHAVSIGVDASGWPVMLLDSAGQRKGLYLSAMTQGSVLSVLVRAYQYTYDDIFLTVARRAVRTFELDILDGGVSTPIGEEGVFFESVGVYPAAHTLTGFLFALFSLYEYVSLTTDSCIEMLLSQGLGTMHHLLAEFDAGYWTRLDLLSRRLASPAELSLQVMLLEVLATYSGCEHCLALASRWRTNQHRLSARLRYQVAHHYASWKHALWSQARTVLFPRPQASEMTEVCIPLTAHPFTGGVLTVLDGIAQVTDDIWHIEYLAQIIGPLPETHVIHRFASVKMTPWHFPLVWFHTLSGAKKLFSLLRQGADYRLLMPQDGLYTAAFAALIGKLAGIRVVCMDHSTLTWPTNGLFHAEKVAAVRRKTWHWTFKCLVLLTLKLYWPSLSLLARISARLVDHYLIPGLPGDEVGEICKQLGIPSHRLTRFASMIDVQSHPLFDAQSRASIRKQKNIAADAIVISIICRLEAEKGLDVAVESIQRALDACSAEVRSRVRVIIAGDGLLRKTLEADVRRLGFAHICMFLGNVPYEEVMILLGISDIFLYTSTRGACIPMSVLEAMASGCAVIASTQPMVNAHLLADERGIAIPPDDVGQTAEALVHLLKDAELCHRMGTQARDYIALHHSPDQFRRTLMRVTGWMALDTLLNHGENTGILEKIGN